MLSRWMPVSRKARAALRSRLPQSRKTTVRSPRSAGGSVTRPSSEKKLYSWGSGSSPASMNIRQSLPIAVRISRMATSEPRASPSGFSWVTTISFWAPRSSLRISSRSDRLPLVVIVAPLEVLRDLGVEQLADAHPAIDGVVVLEGERRRVLEAQFGRHTMLQVALRGAQTVDAGRALGVVSEHAHIYARIAQVGAGLDSCLLYTSDAA